MRLFPAQWADIIDPPTGTLYTATGVGTRVDTFTAYNNGASAVALKVYIGGNDNSQIVMNIEVQPGQSYLCGELAGQDLATGESIFATAATADTISIRASGRLL